MKSTAITFVLFGFGMAVAASASPANLGDGADRLAAEVSGEVAVVPSQPGRPVDASQVVVWLVPVDTVHRVQAPTGKNHYRLLQKNKHFEPNLLVVPVGTVVDFPNADPWFHNVFSLYRGKRFDLGLYQAGAQRSVKFDRVGPSYLFCNIHPEMKGVVLAVDSELFSTSDKSGHYAIAGVAPGKYQLHVWYENAKPEVLQGLQHVVVIEGGDRVLPPISVPAVSQTQAGHKNKYGQDYDPDTLKTDY
jgi:plastocyanin